MIVKAIHANFKVLDSMTADDTLSSSALCISSTSFIIECLFNSFLLTHAIAHATALLHYCLVLDGVVPQSWLAAVWQPWFWFALVVSMFTFLWAAIDFLGIFRFLNFNRLPSKLAMNLVVPSFSLI